MNIKSKKTERNERPNFAGLAKMPPGSFSIQIDDTTNCVKESTEPIRSYQVTISEILAARLSDPT